MCQGFNYVSGIFASCWRVKGHTGMLDTGYWILVWSPSCYPQGKFYSNQLSIIFTHSCPIFRLISDWSLFPCDLTLMPDQRPLACPALHHSAYSNWSLATYPFFSSSKVSHIPFPIFRLISDEERLQNRQQIQSQLQQWHRQRQRPGSTGNGQVPTSSTGKTFTF